MDATCIAYSGQEQQSLIDYRIKYVAGILLSGDLMDDASRVGHHKISVSLQSLPSHIQYLLIIYCFKYQTAKILKFDDRRNKEREKEETKLKRSKKLLFD